MTETQYATPVLVGAQQEPVVLQRIPVSGESAGYNEAFIQDLAFRYPGCLPVTEIDRAFEGLIPVCCELKTDAGYLDVLYVTPKGRLAVVEAKLWRNPEARRKVIGQILDYAKALSRWTYEDLQREVSRTTGRKGNVLYELVAERYPGTDESEFVDEVTRSLAHGRFLLLILGDGIREGVGAIAEFLDETGSLEFTLGLVELALYRTPNDGILLQPRVLAKTVIFRRTVVTLKEGRLVVEEQPEEGEDTRELSELEQFYSGFWPEYIQELRLDDASQPMPRSVGKLGNIFFPMPPSGGQSWITVYFYQKRREAGLFLTFLRGALADRIYEKLLEDRDAIESELGVAVDWNSADGKHSIALRRQYPDLCASEYRQDIKDFFKENVNRFVNVFRPRLERIASELT